MHINQYGFQVTWLLKKVTVGSPLVWQQYSSALITVWSFSKKIEYITMKSSFTKLNITENKKVYLDLTNYFELTSVFQGGVIFWEYCPSCQYSFQWLALKFTFLKRFRDFIVLRNNFTSRVVFKTGLTLKYTLRGPRQFLSFFLPVRKGLLNVKKVARDPKMARDVNGTGYCLMPVRRMCRHQRMIKRIKKKHFLAKMKTGSFECVDLSV